MNDDDNFNPEYPFVYTEDYAIGVCSEGDVKSKYSPIALEMIGNDEYKYNNNIRGLCDKSRPVGVEIPDVDIPSYKSNILKCGYEIIKVWPEGKKETHSRTLAIQSRGDAYFVFAQGNYDIENEPQPLENELYSHFILNLIDWQIAQDIGSVGPFELRSGGYGNISIQEWQTSGLSGEVKWLLSNPECLILNDASWSDWQSLIAPEKVTAICGFRAHTSYGDDLTDFYIYLTNSIWDPSYHSELWSCSVPSNTAIVKWMEYSCLNARKRYNFDCMSFSVAIDFNYRYYIKKGKNTKHRTLPSDLYIYTQIEGDPL